METITKRYVECLFPGSFFSEEMNISWEKFEAEGVPKGCFAYQIFQVVTKNVTVDGEAFTKSTHIPMTGKRYPGGKVYTLAELEAEFAGKPDHRILLDNCRGNGWNRVVLTRRGNWQPLEDDDEVVAE